LRLFSFGGYGLALAALALVIIGAIECPPRSFAMGSETEMIEEITERHRFHESSTQNISLSFCTKPFFLPDA